MSAGVDTKTGATAGAAILAPVSAGELFDKITILEIKAARISDPARLAHVAAELGVLQATRAKAVPDESPALRDLVDGLKAVNLALWDIEDEIRGCERRQDFGARFIELARAVYHTNDRRAALKGDINRLLSSALVEVKSYAPY